MQSRNYTLISINAINYLFPVQRLQRKLPYFKSIMQTTWNIYLSGCTLQRAWFNQTFLCSSLKTDRMVVSTFHGSLSSFRASESKIFTLTIKHICSVVAAHHSQLHANLRKRPSIRMMTVPISSPGLPKPKLQIKREDRAKIPFLSQVLSISTFHLNWKSLFLTLSYPHFIILCILFTNLVLILQITWD